MKITTVESLHADAGWRNLDFLKISTDEGIVGCNEYNESFGGAGVSAVIAALAPALVGKDPRRWEAHVALLYALRRQAAGGRSSTPRGTAWASRSRSPRWPAPTRSTWPRTTSTGTSPP